MYKPVALSAVFSASFAVAGLEEREGTVGVPVSTEGATVSEAEEEEEEEAGELLLLAEAPADSAAKLDATAFVRVAAILLLTSEALTGKKRDNKYEIHVTIKRELYCCR